MSFLMIDIKDGFRVSMITLCYDRNEISCASCYLHLPNLNKVIIQYHIFVIFIFTLCLFILIIIEKEGILYSFIANIWEK